MKTNGAARVLVVDDHPPLLTALGRLLEENGYVVSTAIDGAEALESMRLARPDLIISDIVMPRMDGYALCEAVRARAEWVPIPFIFLTAKDERLDVLKGKALGVEDYITKPFEPTELLLVMQACLERVRAIERTRQADLERLKRQIIIALGHELRTPLTYIVGYTELALDELETDSPQRLDSMLTQIRRGASRLSNLVDDLLLLVRLDGGQIAEEFELVACLHNDLAEIVRQIAADYAQRAAARGLEIEARIEPPIPAVRLCDAMFIDALSRLLDNALKFSAGVGKRVTVTVCGNGDYVEITVVDQGVGIRAEEIDHLFHRFRQIDREQMEQQGVGLGLAIAWELIRLHGGTITVDSQVGYGSAFTIRLPAAAP